jgi:hypothetical protein
MVLPLSRIFSQLPLRTALLVPFLVEIAGTVAIVGYLSLEV